MKLSAVLFGALLSIGFSTLPSAALAQDTSSGGFDTHSGGQGLSNMDTVVGLGLSSWVATASSLAPIIANTYYMVEGRAPALAWSVVGFGLSTVNVALVAADALAVDDDEFQERVTLPLGIATFVTLTTSIYAHVLADEPDAPTDTALVLAPLVGGGEQRTPTGLCVAGTF